MIGYDTPFRRLELIGYFRWDEQLTESLRRKLPWLLHACHRQQFRAIHRSNELFLRSTFEVSGSREFDSYECVWASIQPWHLTYGHNHFGPITVKMPLGNLDGRRFYIFKRDLGRWRHYYLVQRESTKPLFGKRHRAERISPSKIFQRLGSRGRLDARSGTQYEIVLTKPVDLTDAKFIATAHNWCALKRCSGNSKRSALESIDAEIRSEIEKLAKRFPQRKRSILAAL